MAGASKPSPFSREPEGVLIVNKHEGVTSHDIVGDIRHIYHTRKVGHTGTLDPMAEGVLVVLLGRAAKAAEYLVADRKAYRATLRLGITTDTEDVTGTVLSTSDALPSPAEVIRVCREKFTGEIMQIPPMYSALKVNGQKLCDLARSGKTVERAARPITIHSLEVHRIDGTDSDYTLNVVCSSGTYIRTLCADIGTSLGCGGVMASLCRTAVEGYTLNDAVQVADLRQMDEEDLFSRLLPIESLFTDLPKLQPNAFYERLLRNGCAVACHKMHTTAKVGDKLRLSSMDGKFFALGEVILADNEPSVKCQKLFSLEA